MLHYEYEDNLYPQALIGASATGIGSYVITVKLLTCQDNSWIITNYQISFSHVACTAILAAINNFVTDFPT